MIGSLLEVFFAEAFEPDEELFDSLFTATDDQSDEGSLTLEELSRE
jgi:hypothetical protein